VVPLTREVVERRGDQPTNAQVFIADVRQRIAKAASRVVPRTR
jgi:hypothetical protein